MSLMINFPIFSPDMNLAKQLKKLIQNSGITVTNLSKATNISGQTIHNWLAGSKPRDFDQVKRVADHFNLSLDELVYGESLKTKSISALEDQEENILAGVYEVILRRVKK